MHKFYFSIIFLFIFTASFAQEKEEVFYLVSEEQVLSEEVFKSLDPKKVFTRIQENDSTRITHVYRRKNTSQLDRQQHKQIKIFLTKIIGEDFDPKKKTIIHLYSKNNEKLQEDIKNKKYWKWIKKHKSNFQSFLMGTKNSGIEVNRKKHLYKDSYNLLHNFFFKDSDFKMNHLFIKPNGEVIMYYGLESNLRALDWSV